MRFRAEFRMRGKVFFAGPARTSLVRAWLARKPDQTSLLPTLVVLRPGAFPKWPLHSQVAAAYNIGRSIFGIFNVLSFPLLSASIYR